MKKKLVFIFIFLLLISIFYFRNIIYALISGTEKIDKNMLNSMLQGKLKPTKSFSMVIDKKECAIPLPKSAGLIITNKYIIPTKSLKEYKENIRKTEWSHLEQNGTSISMTNSSGKTVNITISSYTGAYLIITYYCMD